MASSANSGGTANNINDYIRASAAENSSSGGGYGVYQGPGQQQAPQAQQLLPADISAFLMSAGAMTRSTPGSPATFSGGLGFHSVRTSPVLGPCMSPVNSGMFANLHPMFGGFDSTVHSAVQSANASPIVGAFNRRELRNSMANLSMAQLPPTAMSYMDTSGMFGSPTTPFSNTGPVPSIAVSSTMDGGSYGRALGSGDALFRAPQGSMQMSPPVTAEFIQHVEETKARGLKLEMEGIPKENAKSRVETQIKITLRLTAEDTGERVTCWSHLALPEQMVSREKFRHRLQQKQGNTGEIGSLPASPQHVVHLEGSIFCSSDPTRKVETCLGCIRREYKRGLRRKDAARLRSGAPSTCTTPAQSRAASPVLGEPNGGARMTGAMEVDWDERRIALEKERILIFNCSDLMDFSKGEVVLPTRITCYCRHHNEKDGFCICVTLRDAQGAVLATHISAPIMITDDHKSTKFKTERRTTRTKAEYERPTAAAMAALGDGSAAYASHALGGHSSHLHVVDGAAAGFAGGRQAMSARSSPTLRPYAHHAMLDTYSQFASLAGTPSLGNTPMGSPMMSAAAAAAAVAAAAAQMGGCGGGGFDAPFNLPQQASLQSFSAASMAAPGFAQHYGLPPNSAAGLGPPASYASFASAPGLSSASGFSSAPSSGGASLLFGNASGFAQQQQQQQQHQQAGGGGGVAGLDQTVIPISQPAAIQITQLLPAQGPVAGGISVLISGRGFHANIAVYFGGVQAGRVQVLSPSNIACVLPPTKAAGPAALRIHDLGSAAAMAAVADGCESQAVFTYVEDTDHTMLELALLATGLRPPPPPPSAPAVAERQQSPHSSPDPAISRSADGSSSAKMLQDAAVLATLRQLRAANDSRNLVEIESGLVNLFATLLGRGMLDVSRLNTRHEATGRTLLHFAALLGMLNLMSFLAAHGVALDDADHNGMTAIHFASMYGRADIVEMLLGAGASYAVRSAMGATPVELARLLGHAQIQMLIEERDGYANFIRDEHQHQS